MVRYSLFCYTQESDMISLIICVLTKIAMISLAFNNGILVKITVRRYCIINP
jgi:hypothetical protein